MTGDRTISLRARAWSFLHSQTPIVVGGTLSLILGLFFVFVWSPLPWGWLGIDHYDDRALKLAAGEPFDTTDVPWGYAYYVALFYVLFGHHPWVPLVFQVLLNTLVPWLLYRLVVRLADPPTAALAALLTGALSFNTVYASTQSSDAVCTVLFLAALLCLEHGWRRTSLGAFAASGALMGLAAQFRPNLILFPAIVVIAGVMIERRQFRRAAIAAMTFTAAVTIVLLPWIVRNYRLTQELLPTSTHGGVQLWYGSLQVGEYLENRAANPRSAFEAATFDYTSLVDLPIVVRLHPGTCDANPRLVYWTDRQTTPTTLAPAARRDGLVEYEIPGQADGTTVYYSVQSSGNDAGQVPFVFFVSRAHLADLDRHHDLLDVFDVVRLMRVIAWNEPIAAGLSLDLDQDGRIGMSDLSRAVALLVLEVDRDSDRRAELQVVGDRVVLTLSDGSTLRVPHVFSGLVTDIEVHGVLASKLVYARRSLATVHRQETAQASVPECHGGAVAGVNDVFYRAEPHKMRRYSALAWDNIRREPVGFAAAALYRMLRVFVIRGTDNQQTTQQFRGSGLVYAAGMLLTAGYLGLFLIGAVVSWRQRSRLLWLLVPIVYVPITIGYVLTNMRYSITVQPLVLTFVAVALLALLRVAPSRPASHRDRRPNAASVRR